MTFLFLYYKTCKVVKIRIKYTCKFKDESIVMWPDVNAIPKRQKLLDKLECSHPRFHVFLFVEGSFLFIETLLKIAHVFVCVLITLDAIQTTKLFVIFAFFTFWLQISGCLMLKLKDFRWYRNIHFLKKESSGSPIIFRLFKGGKQCFKTFIQNQGPGQ